MTSHIPLVGHLVREMMGRLPGHVNRDDLTSAGLTALVQAARGYDAERGVPFARYASTRIRGAILDELRGIDWASRSVRRRARELDETRAALAAELGRVPSDAEVAAAPGMRVDEIARQRRRRPARQRDEPAGLRRHPRVDDMLPTEPRPGGQARAATSGSATSSTPSPLLPERLRVVVEGYFFDERPMADIAAELGVTESRISQMRAEALVLLQGRHEQSRWTPTWSPPHARPDGCRRPPARRLLRRSRLAVVRRPARLGTMSRRPRRLTAHAPDGKVLPRRTQVLGRGRRTGPATESTDGFRTGP